MLVDATMLQTPNHKALGILCPQYSSLKFQVTKIIEKKNHEEALRMDSFLCSLRSLCFLETKNQIKTSRKNKKIFRKQWVFLFVDLWFFCGLFLLR